MTRNIDRQTRSVDVLGSNINSRSIATSFETQRSNWAGPNSYETIAGGSRSCCGRGKSTGTQFAGFSADFLAAGRRSAIASLDWDSIADVRRQRAALKVTRDQWSFVLFFSSSSSFCAVRVFSFNDDAPP
jgi:hypothetical protein